MTQQSLPQQHTSSAAFMRTAWLMVALLFPVALLNYLDRQMLAAMKFSMMADIPSIDSDSKWGTLLASFKWVYAFLSPLGGYLSDRFSRRRMVALSLFVWSAITWLTGHADTYGELLWARALMGVSEACYIPAALALIADFHLGPTRSRAVGMHQMAIYIGIMIGGFSGYVAENPSYGWRFAFNAAGIVGMIYSVPLLFLLKNPPRVESAGNAGPSLLVAFRELFTNGSFLLMMGFFMLPGLAGWMVKDWMPSILKTQFDIGQGKAGVSAALFVNIGALCSAVLGGWLADRWMRKSIRGRIYVGALGVGLLVPALFGVGNSTSLQMAIGFLILFGLGWGLHDCNNMPILCQIARPELRATGYGILNFVGICCGGFADQLFGVMLDHDIPLNVAFGFFAGVCVVAAILALLIKPKEMADT
jgi:MFS transporter, Spinster family, sphingosine-1-phosphate transporter